MIRAQELRVGNLVWNNYSGEMEVSAIWAGQDPACVDLRKNKHYPSGRYGLDDIHPIPLTEEWLDRLPEYLVSEDIPSCVKFIHQLQNWYWVKNKFEKELEFKNPLTGEELIILNDKH